MFFTFCLLGTLAGAVFCMLCMDLTQFVIGSKLSLFSLEFFLKGIYLSFPLVAIISLLLLVMYQIRHPVQKLQSFCTYLVLNVLVWTVLIPLVLQLSLRTDIRPPAAAASVSPGYFRTENDMVHYWSKFSYDGKGEGVAIDLYGLAGSPGTMIPLHDASKPEQKTPANFADSLVLSAIDMPLCVSVPMNAYLHLLYTARDSLARSYLSWLTFASLGLALASVYAICFLSSWRLLDAFIVIIAGVGVALLNYAFSAGIIGKTLSLIWQRGLGEFGIRFPLTACLNVCIALLFIISGLCRHFLRQAKEGGAE